MTVALVKYEAARKALAAAHGVDEVRDIRDKSVAMQTYARQAKDRELIEYATEIRMRAERRLGEMMAAQPKAKGGEHGGKANLDGFRENPSNPTPTLAETGIDKNLADRARKAAAMSEEKFEERVTEAKRTAVSALERATADDKKERRAEREAELGTRILAAPEMIYGVIYADPPWRFEPYSRDTGMDRAPENHYPTMTLDAIKALDVPAAADAVLFLWATSPMLPEALDVMRAWGFQYRSHFVWDKKAIGTGYWARSAHELLLIGVRGNVPAPAPGEQYPSLISARRGEHSAKPFCFREMIEDMFPTLPRIELFARERCEGWDAWGNETPNVAAE